MINDPYFAREMQKYKNPIPSRKYILSVIKKKKYTQKQLCTLLKLAPEQNRALGKRLKAMVRDKQLSCDINGFYYLFSNDELLVGRIIANSKGFGFIKLDKGGKDLRLNSKQMQLVFNGDKVKAKILNNKFDAEIVSVIESVKTLVGRLHIEKNNIFVVVDDKRITRNINIPKVDKQYNHNSVVIIDIIKRPTFDLLAEGRIITVLGDFLDKGLEAKSALIRYQIPHKFKENTLLEAKKISNKVSDKDKRNKIDLTNMPFVTIDGDDSKDFDDAVFATNTGKHYKLFVAIADVSSYVKENSSLDKEAYERGNSVYFPNLVTPMLPENISNGICSLNPTVERLVLVCEMDISKDGELLSYKFYNGVIISQQRLTYDQVNDFITSNNADFINNKEVEENINNLYKIYKNLKRACIKRGVMDFNRAESKIIFDDNGKIKDIVAVHRNDAHKLIEECMLLANQAAALFLTKENENFLYRVHPQPVVDKINAMRKFLATFGLILEGKENLVSKDFAKIIKQSLGKKYENIIKTAVLRSMNQATYSPNNVGHFGLAFDDYTHFTSPIRRYSDLLVHRAIKRIINKQKVKNIDNMLQIGEHLSITERRADDASRDVIMWLKCEYMLDKVGQSFNGVIVAVTSFGLFVELNDIFIEGFIAIYDLSNDYYLYSESNMQLTGKRSNKSYKLGDEVKVKVANVNLDDRKISFLINNK